MTVRGLTGKRRRIDSSYDPFLPSTARQKIWVPGEQFSILFQIPAGFYMSWAVITEGRTSSTTPSGGAGGGGGACAYMTNFLLTPLIGGAYKIQVTRFPGATLQIRALDGLQQFLIDETGNDLILSLSSSSVSGGWFANYNSGYAVVRQGGAGATLGTSRAGGGAGTMYGNGLGTAGATPGESGVNSVGTRSPGSTASGGGGGGASIRGGTNLAFQTYNDLRGADYGGGGGRGTGIATPGGKGIFRIFAHSNGSPTIFPNNANVGST